jgi:hypothetical protein
MNRGGTESEQSEFNKHKAVRQLFGFFCITMLNREIEHSRCIVELNYTRHEIINLQLIIKKKFPLSENAFGFRRRLNHNI